QPVVQGPVGDGEQPDAAAADHQEGHGLDRDPGAAAAAEGQGALGPLGHGAAVLPAAGGEAEAHPGHGHDDGAVFGLDGIPHHGVDVHHLLDAFHGGLHQALDGVVHGSTP